MQLFQTGVIGYAFLLTNKLNSFITKGQSHIGLLSNGVKDKIKMSAQQKLSSNEASQSIDTGEWKYEKIFNIAKNYQSKC